MAWPEAFAGVLAQAPVPLDPRAVSVRIADEAVRDIDAVLDHYRA